jgi:hypothetical protein
MVYIVNAVVLFIAFVWFFGQYKADKLKELNNPFESKFYRNLYTLSHIPPFTWFVEDDKDLTRKGLIMKDQLEKGGYANKLTVRSYMALKVILLLICLVAAGITLLVMYNTGAVTKVLLNIASNNGSSLTTKKIILVVSFYLFLALIPNQVIKNRAKKAIALHNKDLPMIQMFTILMLRSNKTVAEILFALSKLNTTHKEVFERGYRVYLRNKIEGMNFLRSKFDNHRFIEMFNLLEDIAEFAKKECISIMEGNMKALVEETNTIRRRNDMSRLVFSQASMILPYLGVIMLGAVPVILMSMKNLIGATG